ncbi:MAG: inorganic phosphate transporter [Acidobacteriaceae bacterium]|nr:inorganic phosphate transporter [Acidobacteriaceae bacterium]
MTVAVKEGVSQSAALQAKLKRTPGKKSFGVFGAIILAGIVYAGVHVSNDLSRVHNISGWPYILLGIALLVALGFEFVNGFHDTANAVATVIYTHSLDPHVAVIWSGIWNLIGVLTSSGGVAFAVLSLLPIEIILKAGSGAGFAAVFALLLAAITWNLGTWALGLPASSSHTLIGSMIGVGIANQLMNGSNGASGVDWGQVANVFRALFISPIVGFSFAALMLIILKQVVKDQQLYEAPVGNEPPPFWIRVLLILTCTGVSFGHGSNDGQKGMGLIMLILIGTVPTAYALNHALGFSQTQDFVAVSESAARVFEHYAPQGIEVNDARTVLTTYIRSKDLVPDVIPAARRMADEITHQVAPHHQLADVPDDQQRNVRNDMYVESETLRLLAKSNEEKGVPPFTAADKETLKNYEDHLDHATKFIPAWVKVAVALALGLGTMVGWRRIVITVGERIGKEHLTYAQGASAEIVAAATIIAADRFHLPVSTTHVLSSGVAGTMLANGSGLRMQTIRNILLAWLFTLPAAAFIAGGIYYGLRLFVK